MMPYREIINLIMKMYKTALQDMVKNGLTVLIGAYAVCHFLAAEINSNMPSCF